jgi:ATP-binding cassette subfamily C (CFTR/MRP) protein 10
MFLWVFMQIGVMACRFSSDVDTIDDDLPFILNIFLSEAFEMLGTLVVLVISQPLLFAAFVPLAFIYRRMQACSPSRNLPVSRAG